jgi:hypothetical protein
LLYHSEVGWLKIGYLADIFSEVNDLNTLMLGHDQTTAGLPEKNSNQEKVEVVDSKDK